MSECKNLKECIDEIRKMANEFDIKVKVDEQGWLVEQERDELQAQVAVLRKGMEFIADTTSHKRAVQLAIRFVATTPADAAERVQRLVSTLELASNCLVDGSAIKNEAQKALSEWRRDKCSS